MGLPVPRATEAHPTAGAVGGHGDSPAGFQQGCAAAPTSCVWTECQAPLSCGRAAKISRSAASMEGAAAHANTPSTECPCGIAVPLLQQKEAASVKSGAQVSREGCNNSRVEFNSNLSFMQLFLNNPGCPAHRVRITEILSWDWVFLFLFCIRK